jgi:hypothetical protein
MKPAHVRGDGPKVNIPLRTSLNETAQFPLQFLLAVDLILSSHTQLNVLLPYPRVLGVPPPAILARDPTRKSVIDRLPQRRQHSLLSRPPSSGFPAS